MGWPVRFVHGFAGGESGELLQGPGSMLATRGLGFRVWGLGFRVEGLRFRVSGLRLEDYGCRPYTPNPKMTPATKKGSLSAWCSDVTVSVVRAPAARKDFF